MLLTRKYRLLGVMIDLCGGDDDDDDGVPDQRHCTAPAELYRIYKLFWYEMAFRLMCGLRGTELSPHLRQKRLPHSGGDLLSKGGMGEEVRTLSGWMM